MEKVDKELKTIAKTTADAGVTTMTEELTGFLNDLKKKWMDETRRSFDLELQKAIDAQKIEISQVMRKTFGLDQNLPVSKAEVVEIIRKAALDNAESGKRTPASNTSDLNTPDGADLNDPLSKMVKTFEGGK